MPWHSVILGLLLLVCCLTILLWGPVWSYIRRRRDRDNRPDFTP